MWLYIRTCWWKCFTVLYKQYLLLLTYFPISTEGCPFHVSLGRACVPATMHLASLHICRSFQPHLCYSIDIHLITLCVLSAFSCVNFPVWHMWPNNIRTYFRGKIDGTAITGYYAYSTYHPSTLLSVLQWGLGSKSHLAVMMTTSECLSPSFGHPCKCGKLIVVSKSEYVNSSIICIRLHLKHFL